MLNTVSSTVSPQIAFKRLPREESLTPGERAFVERMRGIRDESKLLAKAGYRLRGIDDLPVCAIPPELGSDEFSFKEQGTQKPLGTLSAKDILHTNMETIRNALRNLLANPPVDTNANNLLVRSGARVWMA